MPKCKLAMKEKKIPKTEGKRALKIPTRIH